MGQFDRQLSTRVERLRGHALYCVYLFYFLFFEKKGRGRMEKFFGLFDIGVRNPAKTTIESFEKLKCRSIRQPEGRQNRFISSRGLTFLAVR
jgi:hypothetical protein